MKTLAVVTVPHCRHHGAVGRRPRRCRREDEGHRRRPPALSPRRSRPRRPPFATVPALTLAVVAAVLLRRCHRGALSCRCCRHDGVGHHLSALSPCRCWLWPSSLGAVPSMSSLGRHRCPSAVSPHRRWPPSLSFSSVTAQTLAAIVPLRLCHCEGVGHRPSLLSFAVVPLKSSRPPSSPLSTAITAAPGCPLVANDVPSWPTMSPRGQRCPLMANHVPSFVANDVPSCPMSPHSWPTMSPPGQRCPLMANDVPLCPMSPHGQRCPLIHGQ